jgi:hypothetical protein
MLMLASADLYVDAEEISEDNSLNVKPNASSKLTPEIPKIVTDLEKIRYMEHVNYFDRISNEAISMVKSIGHTEFMSKGLKNALPNVLSVLQNSVKHSSSEVVKYVGATEPNSHEAYLSFLLLQQKAFVDLKDPAGSLVRAWQGKPHGSVSAEEQWDLIAGLVVMELNEKKYSIVAENKEIVMDGVTLNYHAGPVSNKIRANLVKALGENEVTNTHVQAIKQVVNEYILNLMIQLQSEDLETIRNEILVSKHETNKIEQSLASLFLKSIETSRNNTRSNLDIKKTAADVIASSTASASISAMTDLVYSISVLGVVALGLVLGFRRIPNSSSTNEYKRSELLSSKEELILLKLQQNTKEAMMWSIKAVGVNRAKAGSSEDYAKTILENLQKFDKYLDKEYKVIGAPKSIKRSRSVIRRPKKDNDFGDIEYTNKTKENKKEILENTRELVMKGKRKVSRKKQRYPL